MRIAIVAEEAAGAQALRRVLATGHVVPLVLTSHDLTGPIAGLASQAAAEVLDARVVRTPAFARLLQQHAIDVLLNVHSLFVIHPTAIDAVAGRAFNLHPGPLPEFAGLNTVSWAIYEGATEYGATLHWLATDIDAGPIAYAARFPLDPSVTAGRLMSRSVQHGLGLLDALLAQLWSDPRELPLHPQDVSRRRYYGKTIPHHGRVEWSRDTAAQIERMVRACDYGPFPSPWGATTAHLHDRDIALMRVHVGDACEASPGSTSIAGESLLVATAEGWLAIDHARVDGAPVAGYRLVDVLESAS